MLPKENRLRHDKDIKALFGKAKSVFDDVCGMKFRENRLDVSRFAVVVGTKVSKRAVDRNRIRRQIRAMIHERLDRIRPGFDVAILVRPGSLKKTRQEIEKHLDSVLHRAKLL